MKADLIVVDRDWRTFGLVEVMAKVAGAEQIEHWRHRLDQSRPSIVFGILVDPETIRLFKREQGTFAPVAELKARQVFGHYTPEFAPIKTRLGDIPLSRDYIRGLAGGWLRDLANHWKSANPPGTEDLSGTGFLERVQGGFAANKTVIRRARARRY
jgi:hypothetical protein